HLEVEFERGAQATACDVVCDLVGESGLARPGPGRDDDDLAAAEPLSHPVDAADARLQADDAAALLRRLKPLEVLGQAIANRARLARCTRVGDGAEQGPFGVGSKLGALAL